MKKEVKIKSICVYAGHSVKESGVVNLTLRSSYEHLTGTMKLMQMLNNDVNVKIKTSESVLKLGSYRIKNILIDSDGESKINLTSTNDFADLQNLNKMSELGVEQRFAIQFYSEIEIEEEGGEKDE